MDKLLVYVREELVKILQEKTGWGRNEVLSAFDKAWAHGLARYAREKGVQLE